MENLKPQKKQIKLELIPIKKLNTSNIYVSVAWTGSLPFIPFVGASPDRHQLANQKEDSELIN